MLQMRGAPGEGMIWVRDMVPSWPWREASVAETPRARGQVQGKAVGWQCQRLRALQASAKSRGSPGSMGTTSAL